MHKKEIILGVDPGSNVTGYAILEIKNNQLAVKTIGTIDLRKHEIYDKLSLIINELTKIIHMFKPTIFSIETPFYGKNIQSMLKLGRAQGVAIACARNFNLPVFEYSPRRVKQIISGSGRSSKLQIKHILLKKFNIENINTLDGSDALSIALCHYYLTDSNHTYNAGLVKKQKRNLKKQWTDFLKTPAGREKMK